MEDLLTAKDIATYMGVSINTVGKYRKNRGLPAIKLGGEWKFTKEAFAQWLNAQQVVQTAKSN